MYTVRPHAAAAGTVTLNCTEAPLDCLPLCPGGGAACSDYALPPPPPPPLVPVVPRGAADRHAAAPVRLLLVISLLSAFLFLSLALSTLLLYRRRRLVLRRRRRRLAAAGGDADDDGAFGDEEEGGGGGGGVVHHVWYIRTVGLDEATIASIAAVEYRRGGVAGDCAVCLGEFGDGELVRLLPRCKHPFHAPCIDTWLRAHVTCPVCRSPVVVAPSDLPVAAAAEAEAGAAQSGQHHGHGPDEMSLSQSSESETEGGSEDSDSSSAAQSEATTATAEEDGRDTPKPIRRSASMDSPLFLVAVPEAHDDVVRYSCKVPNAREMKVFRVKEKEGAGTSSSSCQSGRFKIGRSMSSSGQGFFFSRNGRSSGAVLPL